MQRVAGQLHREPIPLLCRGSRDDRTGIGLSMAASTVNEVRRVPSNSSVMTSSASISNRSVSVG